MHLLKKPFDGLSRVRALEPAERRFLAGAWLLAPSASLVLHDKGFTTLLDWLKTTSRIRLDGGDGRVGVERAEALVASAFARQLSTRSCLPKALVQFVLHRFFGPSPKLVIGVRRDAALRRGETNLDWSLDAHAWVERRDGPPRDFGFAPILAFSDEDGVWRASPKVAHQ